MLAKQIANTKPCQWLTVAITEDEVLAGVEFTLDQLGPY
jgi:hypothetical protein